VVKREPRVSVAVPVHNEAKVLPELLVRIRAVLTSVPGGPHQILFVDDGSSDDTLRILREEAAKDPCIEVVSLARNFGHQVAVTAALDFVIGDVTIVMDADLQDPPEVIPSFLEEYRKGFDVVYARRVKRTESWALRFSYFLFYRLIAKLSDLKLPLDAGDFGLMSRRVVAQLRETREHHRYIRGLRTWVGFQQTGIEVERSSRYAGASKYSVAKLVKLAADGVFAFSTAPLRAAALMGAVAMTLSFTFAAYALYAKLVLGRSPQGFTALIVSITFLSGVQLLFLGVIGEYLGRVYEEVKRRPIYVVAKRIVAGNELPEEPTSVAQ
jgi:dolichol-phosphate mannosyltransferase